MKIKSNVWHGMAAASGTAALLLGMGIEGGTQVGQPISDTAFLAAMALILAAICFLRLGFRAQKMEQRCSKRVHQKPDRTVKNGRRAG